MSGTVIDKATAFKNSVTGSGINKIVCKASSHEVNGPKKKHVDFLIGLTEDQRMSMPELADMLLERTRNGSWVVAFKALISAHNLMVLGNERFMQCMASRPTAFGLDSYTDKSTPQAYNMSIYIRRYAKYLKSYCDVYRQLAMDVMKAKKGEHGDFQAMDHQQLLKTIGLMDGLIDAHLELNMNVIDMVNGVINTCFLMMYKDLVRLYQVYNDAMISLLEKFFEMKRVQAKEAFELYKKCPGKLESMKKFFELAEDLGLETKSHLNLKPVPNELLPALEEHLKDMEKKGFSSASTSEAAASIKLKLREAPVRETTTAAPPTATPPTSQSASDFLEEQRRKLEEFSRNKAQTKGSSTPPPKASPATGTANHKKQSASVDDLLGLDFASPSEATSSGQWPSQGPAAPTNPFGSFGSGTGYQEVDFFKPQPAVQGGGGQGSMQVNFETAFGSPSVPSQDSSFGASDILQPERVGGGPPTTQMQPLRPAPLGSSVDQGLASTVQQLALGPGPSKTGAVPKTHHQWKPPTEMKLTGGANWKQTGLQATTLPPTGHYPYGPPMGGVAPAQGWGTGTTPMYGMQHPGVGMQVGMGPAMQPGMGYGMPQGYGMHPMGMQQQPAPSNPFGSTQAPF